MSAYRKKSRKANPNRVLGTMDVLHRLQDGCPIAFDAARVVGRWVWLEFESKPADSVRAFVGELGFHWNRQRQAWQHPCGMFCTRSPGEPRFKYGQVPASAMLADDDGKAVA